MTTFLEQFCQDFLNQFKNPSDVNNYEKLFITWNAFHSCELFSMAPGDPHFKWRIRPLSMNNDVVGYFYLPELQETREVILPLMYKDFNIRDETHSDYVMFLYEMYPEAFWGY